MSKSQCNQDEAIVVYKITSVISKIDAINY